MTRLTARFEDALHYANTLHATQHRKGTDVPYLSHLLGVVSLVLDDGGDEDEAIAALLHDAAEDQGGRARLDDIRSRYGDKVARIVEHFTDSWTQPKEPWVERKRRYVDLASSLPADALRVSAADKVHNAYTLLRDLRNVGEAVWGRFNAKADDIVEYYVSLVRAFKQTGGGSLVKELERIVNGIQREMGY